MAQVTILVRGKPTKVNEIRPGLFGELGYQYVGTPPPRPAPAAPRPAPAAPRPAPVPSGYTGVSIVDYLKSIGKASDFSSRRVLAKQKGIANYTGTSKQNTDLLKLLRGF